MEFTNASWKHLTNTDNGVHCSISIFHQFRQVLIKSGVNLYSEKDQNCNYHFDNGVHDRAISVLKWVKILVIIMGLANASWQDCHNFDLFKNGNSPSTNPIIKMGVTKSLVTNASLWNSTARSIEIVFGWCWWILEADPPPPFLGLYVDEI